MGNSNNLEIERKFLLKKPLDLEVLRSIPNVVMSIQHIQQGYLNGGITKVRVRISNQKAFLTVKGKLNGISREEYESEVHMEIAKAMMDQCTNIIRKRRYILSCEGGEVWEVDEFLGDLEGIWQAEIELEHEAQPFSVFPWLGREVTMEECFLNSNLNCMKVKALAMCKEEFKLG